MLIQFHHQFKYHTEMIVQLEIKDTDDIQKVFVEHCSNHPLPKGARWSVCAEDSIDFIKAVTPVAVGRPVWRA